MTLLELPEIGALGDVPPLFGILPSSTTLEDVKNERLAKYS